MTRDQWRLVITGYAILTLFWLIGAGWTWKLEGDTKDTLKGVQANQHRIQRITVQGATLICAIAEGNEASDLAVITAFANGQPLPEAALLPICRKAQRQAIKDVLGQP